MAQHQMFRSGFRRGFACLRRIRLERETLQILQKNFLPVVHRGVAKNNFSTNVTNLFYDSLDKEFEETITDDKSDIYPKDTLKPTIFKAFDLFESNPERYYFVRIYQDLNDELSRARNAEGEAQDNFKLLSYTQNSISKVFKKDQIESIRSTKDFDAKLDALFNGLQKLLTLTRVEDKKTKTYLTKVQMLLADLSCYIFDQLCDKQNLNEVYQKKLFFNLAYLWLKVECHLKEILYGINNISFQWNEKSTFFLKIVSHYLLKDQNVKIKNLNSQEFLFCLSLIGLHRRLPGMALNASEWNISKQTFPLPKHTEEMALSCFPQFSMEEVGVLAHSLFSANLHPN